MSERVEILRLVLCIHELCVVGLQTQLKEHAARFYMMRTLSMDPMHAVSDSLLPYIHHTDRVKELRRILRIVADSIVFANKVAPSS